jgi:hypothetical protein
MAKITDVFVNGTLGNLVFYTRMGKTLVRMRTQHIKQTEATKKRGANFGIAAKAGRGLRSGLREAMPRLPTEARKAGFPEPFQNGLVNRMLILGSQMTRFPLATLLLLRDKGFFTRFKVPRADQPAGRKCDQGED